MNNELFKNSPQEILWSRKKHINKTPPKIDEKITGAPSLFKTIKQHTRVVNSNNSVNIIHLLFVDTQADSIINIWSLLALRQRKQKHFEIKTQSSIFKNQNLKILPQRL